MGRRLEGIQAIRKFLDSLEDFDPDYARGLIEGIVNEFEANGVNMSLILQEAQEASEEETEPEEEAKEVE